MSDLIIFVIGGGVSAVVFGAVSLLVWGASQERYVSGRHVGDDLLSKAESFVGGTPEPLPQGRVLRGGKRREGARARNRVRVG